MICPKCEAEIFVLHEDPIECTDCGATMNIQYCVCPKCHYSFRLNNNEFLDEMQVDMDSMEGVMEDMEELLDELEDGDSTVEMAWAGPYLGNMSDLMKPCVRCGSFITVYDEKSNEYECLDCGFKWEILTNG